MRKLIFKKLLTQLTENRSSSQKRIKLLTVLWHTVRVMWIFNISSLLREQVDLSSCLLFFVI